MKIHSLEHSKIRYYVARMNTGSCIMSMAQLIQQDF